MEPLTLKEIMQFFGMTSAQFAREWKCLTPQDKADIKAGLSSGSLSY